LAVRAWIRPATSIKPHTATRLLLVILNSFAVACVLSEGQFHPMPISYRLLDIVSSSKMTIMEIIFSGQAPAPGTPCRQPEA
jgi:hypothetical protein